MSVVKKALLLSDLLEFGTVDKVIIESLEQSLYRMEVYHQGQSYYVMESKSKGLSRRSIVEMQSLLLPLTIYAMYLRHTSPYDEMIGVDTAAGNNELLVPLGNFFEGVTEATKH